MKTKNFDFIKIKQIKIDKQYSATSQQINITRDKSKSAVVNMSTINKIRRVSKLEDIKSYHEYFLNFCNALNIQKNDNVMWRDILGKTKNVEYLKYLKKELESSQKLITTYHNVIYPKRVKVYQNLHPVMLNGTILEIPVYNHSSVTGRTSIISGYNFLTMKKEERQKLKSANKEEVLVEIDVKSCEPSFYLKALGREIGEGDVYKAIAENANIKITDRSRFKRGILSILYGASENTSKNILKCTKETIKKIKSYFQIDEFKKELEDIFEDKGMIYSYYGRPICFNHSLVNYWIQSSSVDYCSLAFSNLISEYDLKPCFFVHDSVTVSVRKSDLQRILKVKSVRDPYSNFEIPVEVLPLTE